jgi:hypothetical protein
VVVHPDFTMMSPAFNSVVVSERQGQETGFDSLHIPVLDGHAANSARLPYSMSVGQVACGAM